MPRPGQDIEHAGGMDRDIFCAGCGYNLRRGAVVGRCPECGESYDTRALTRRGIFFPQDIGLPWGDALVVLLCGAIGGWTLYAAVVGSEAWAYFIAVPFLLFFLAFLYALVHKLTKYLRYRSLVRRIARDAATRE